MGKKRGRPKENRVTMNITVKPRTRKVLHKAVNKANKKFNTVGKVVDDLANPE